MKQSTLGDYEDTGVTCPICGDGYGTYKAYAIHFTKSDSHNGIPLVELVGESTFRDCHWTLTREEMADELGVGTSTLGNTIEKLGLPRASEKNRVEYEWGEDICEVLDQLHNEEQMTTTEMAEELSVARRSMDRWWEDCDVPKRGQSEASRLAYEQMSAEKRAEITESAREAHFEIYGDGGHIGRWVAENPNAHQEAASEAAHLGTPARETNGMKGVTGQDSPTWRGGKSIYGAVKKQLHGPSWSSIRKVHLDDVCHKCGAVGDLHLHHIVPLMSGGTNESWNLMTLCAVCHTTVENYIRQFDAFDPVLTE